MNEAKKSIINRIRNALGRETLPPEVPPPIELRLDPLPMRITPGRVMLQKPESVDEFIRMTTGEATTVRRVDREEDVPEAVAAYISEHGLHEAAVLAPDQSIQRLPWEKTSIRIRYGRGEKGDQTSVTPAFAGIAETGCLMMLSGPNHPYTLNFLPENHIAILKSSRIVATPEDAFDLLRKDFRTGRMPRTVLMVAGPSRSADIGYSLQFGAHGPRRLHCILVN